MSIIESRYSYYQRNYDTICFFNEIMKNDIYILKMKHIYSCASNDIAVLHSERWSPSCMPSAALKCMSFPLLKKLLLSVEINIFKEFCDFPHPLYITLSSASFIFAIQETILYLKKNHVSVRKTLYTI